VGVADWSGHGRLLDVIAGLRKRLGDGGELIAVAAPVIG
jgi:hypothetical protein